MNQYKPFESLDSDLLKNNSMHLSIFENVCQPELPADLR